MSQPHASQAVNTQPRENYTDMPVGEILRRTRMHYGQSLEDVEAMIRIRAQQLQALEDGRVDLLPGRVYAIGFVRSYAEYLGLDGEKMVQLFKAQGGNAVKPKPELHFPVAASESKIPNLYVLGCSMAGLVLVLAALMLMTGGEDAPESTIPEVPAHMRADAPVAAAAPDTTLSADAQGLPVGSAETTLGAMDPAMLQALAPDQPAAEQAFPPAKPERNELVIRITDTAWVEVRNADGRALLSRVLKPGDSYTVPPEPGMIMDTGNIGGLEFVLNGQVLPPMGPKGDVRRKISLDPEALAPMAAAATQPEAGAQNAASVIPAAGAE